jgi:hypothetical protein
VAGGYWALWTSWTVVRTLIIPHPDTILPAGRDHPAIVINQWSIVLPLTAITAFAGLVGVGMVLDWPWVRGWAKFFGWFGIASSVLCCIPVALYAPSYTMGLSFAAVISVLSLIMSIVTLWSLKETA